jgi:hypothetical protein
MNHETVYSCTAGMSASLMSVLVVGVWVGFSKMWSLSTQRYGYLI